MTKLTPQRPLRKLWTKRDRHHLMVAYRSGASLKTMSQILNRSETAINKALTRQGIRPLGSQPRGVRPKSLTKLMTPSMVKEKIQEATAWEDLTEDSPSSVSFDPKVAWAYEALHSLPETREKREMSPWITLEALMAYLSEQGYPVTFQGKGCAEQYWIRQKGPLTPGALLIFANKMRLEKHKPPFYVEQLTEV